MDENTWNKETCGYKNGVTWVMSLWLYSAHKEPHEYIVGICKELMLNCAMGYSTPELRLHGRLHVLARKIEAYANRPTRWIQWREDMNYEYDRISRQEKTRWDDIDWLAVAENWKWCLEETLDNSDKERGE